MGAISLTIYGQPANITAVDIPVLSERTCELLKEKNGSLVEGDHHKKVVDLTRLIGTRPLVAKNQTKAKIVSLLLTAIAIAALAVGVYFAVAGYAAVAFTMTAAKLFGGVLGASVFMAMNRVYTSNLLGINLARPESVIDSFRKFFVPLHIAFTASTRLETTIVKRTTQIQELFEKSIKAYTQHYEAAAAALASVKAEKQQAYRTWSCENEKAAQEKEIDFAALLGGGTLLQGSTLAQEIVELEKTEKEIQAMNLFLKTLPNEPSSL